MSPMQLAFLATMIAGAIFTAPAHAQAPTDADRLAFESSLLGVDANGDGDYVDEGDTQGILAYIREPGQAQNAPAALKHAENAWACNVYVTANQDGSRARIAQLAYAYVGGQFRILNLPQNWEPPVDALIAGAEQLDAAMAYGIELDIRGRSGDAARLSEWEHVGTEDGLYIVEFTFKNGDVRRYTVKKRADGTFYFSRRK